MSESALIDHRKHRFYWLFLLGFAGAMVGLLWAVRGPLFSGAEPMFRGKPESYWVTNVTYWPGDSEVKQWREFGPDGVGVLVRGLKNASPSGQRFYRQTYRQMVAHLPGVFVRWLPAPKNDTTHSTRMCLISMLNRLGSNADIAEPIMARMLKDESTSVRQTAINFFTQNEDEKALLNHLDAREKRKLLPDFIRALEEPGRDNWGLRNNAAFALRYYPEERQVVAPVLVKALQDPNPTVRLVVAGALNQIDPETSKRVRAVAVVLPILKDPDNQVAFRAAELLGKMKNETEVTVPALIETLENTNTLVACTAVWAFEWGEQFRPYGTVIVPALTKAAQRKDNVAGYAKVALKRFEPPASTSPKQTTVSPESIPLR